MNHSKDHRVYNSVDVNFSFIIRRSKCQKSEKYFTRFD